MRPRVLCRVIGGVGVVLIAIVSLIPGDVQVRTPLPHDLEHFAAYMLTGGVLAMGFASPLAALGIAALLCVEAGLMEVLQGWVPGRHTSLDTALISAAGALLGVMSGGVLQAIMLGEVNRVAEGEGVGRPETRTPPPRRSDAVPGSANLQQP